MTAHHTTGKGPINWPTILFLTGTSLAALAWPVYAYFYGVTTGQLLLALFYFAVTGLSITVGYHRLISHVAFKCHPWLKAALLLGATPAWQGSALDWGADHVRHHAYIDTDRDPYNIKRGFWYAHVGWLLRYEAPADEDLPAYLTSDRLVMLQDRYYVPLAITTGFLIPLLLGGVGGLLLAGAVRTVLVQHCTWFINSWAHVGHYRPYKTNISAADNWFLAFFTFGEGYHNFHHAFPGDYRNGIAKLSWDPSKWLIWVFSKTGVAWDLKRTSPTTIWRRRVGAALTYDGSWVTKEFLVRRARESLEVLVRRTERQLSKMAGRLSDVQISAVAIDKADLQKQLASHIEVWKAARDERRVRRAHRVAEMLERLSAYRDLLDRLMTGYGASPA
ncbi:MAG: acyl-CoA desaturase [Gammaproteobacteria bacterium]|nr:acyl-CoA desaturase [Gammaproteobacteria bacterium]